MTNETHGYIYELLRELGLSSFQASTGEFLLVRPLKIVLILVLATVASRLARRTLKRVLHTAQTRAPLRGNPVRATQRANTVGDVVTSIVRIAIYTVAFFMALAQVGLNLGPLIAGAGIVGVALGFGAQSLVRDFISGLFILLEDQYGVGDQIELGAEVSGTVEEVNLRTTRVRGADGTVWFVPNGEVRRVGNASMEFSRAVVDIPLSKETDVAAALKAVGAEAEKLATDWPDRVTEAPLVLGVQNLAVDGPVIRVTAATEPGQQYAVARELRARVADRLRRDAAKTASRRR